MSNKAFFRMFIKQPMVNASITPSSKRAARKMVEGLNLGQMKYVVELGPGTGVFTDILSASLPSDCRVLLVELEGSFIKNLENKYDHRFEVVQSSACELDKLLRERCVKNVDLVISSLPFNMPEKVKLVVLEVLALLKCQTITKVLQQLKPLKEKR